MSGIRRHKTGALAALILGLAALLSIVAIASVLAFYYLKGGGASATAQIDSIAIMPFVNTNGDPDTEYLSDGLTESIINSLSQLPNLTVMARSTVFRYKGKEIDPERVAHELKVQAILTGRVLQRGDNLSVSAELVDVRTGRQIWGEQYNRKLTDVIAVQEEISKQISEKLRSRLAGEEQKQTARRDTTNAEAYQLYWKGRYYWNKRTESDLRKSIEYFEQAIEIDPSYALAYAGLADAYQVLPSYAQIAPAESYPKAKAAAMKALELDPTMAEPHAALGVVKYEYEWDFAGAEREYKRAIELNPNYPSAHQWYAEFLSTMGRHDEAISEAKRALELDPLSLIINAILGLMYSDARQTDRALEQLQKTVEMDPNFARAYLFLSFAYEEKGMFEQSIAALQKLSTLSGMPPERAAKDADALRAAYKAAGVRGYWQKKAELSVEYYNHGQEPAASVAINYAHAGDKERAFEWLEKAYKLREAKLLSVKGDPAFDDMRSDPRLQDLMRRVGLPQ